MCSEGRFRCSLRICALALLVCLVFAPQPAYTQSKSVTVAGSRPAGSASGNHLEVIALNAALGAGTAAVVALITRKPVVKAAALGAAGGSVTYVGKTLATRDFSGAGFMGRQIGAVGASLTRDAVEGHEPFQRFILPLGIARLHVDAGAEQRVRVRADLAAIIASLSAIAGGGDLDFKRSLSKGTPVFHVTRSDPEWYGGWQV